MSDPRHPALPPWLEVTVAPRNAIGDPIARPAVVPGAAARTRTALFDALARALDLPAHFGRNWDALADSLRDRLDAGPLTLVVDDGPQLLADEPAASFGTLLAVLGEAAAQGRHPLRVVLRGEPEQLAALRRRSALALPTADPPSPSDGPAVDRR
jgi:RNAse (barnase) inhibitor barstar